MRTPTKHAFVLALSVGAVTPFTCNAQVATALLRELDPIAPGGPTVNALNNTAVNAIGGYAITVNTSDSLSNVWGNLEGGPGALIRSEGKYDGIAQTSYETFFGIGNMHVTYSPLGSSGGFTGLDCVFRDDTRIMAERDPHPILPGQFWVFGSRPNITSDGQVWFVGGISSTSGGSTQNRGLFTGGNSDSVVLLGGDIVPGFPDPLNTGTTVDFDFRVSQNGKHYIAPVVLTGGTATDTAIVIDGAAAMAGGSVLREGTVVPISAGGNGTETYQNFDIVGITDSGDWMVTGDTNAAATTDEFVMINGVIVLRDGQSVGGEVVQGDIEGGYLNNDGDYAVTWDIAGNTREALIVNGQLVLAEGDTVDWDGDGVPEDTSVLTDFTGISTVTLSNRVGGVVNVYFTADVNVNGTVLEGFFRLPVEVGGEPTCPCNWNADKTLNSQDFFDFLSDFFDNNADFNNDKVTNSQDFFDFLGCFFEGC